MNRTSFLPYLGDIEPAMYQRRGSFHLGATLTQQNDVVLFDADFGGDGLFYQYVGDDPLPYEVVKNSTPDANWVSVGKATAFERKVNTFTFKEGGVLTNPNDIIFDHVTGERYNWNGVLPKPVPAGSTVESTGGVGKTAWSAGLSGLNERMGGLEKNHALTDVNHTGNFNSIQLAVNATAPRGSVIVSGKKYTESVVTGNADISGVGYASEINVGSENYALKVLQSQPHWERRKVSNLAIKGDKSENSVGVLYDPSDALAGRWDVSYVGIANVDIGIKKPAGNIGNVFEKINFRTSNYGYRAQSSSSPIMHSGCDTFRDCYFQSIDKYCIDIVNTVDGGGSIQIQDSIFELCKGGGIRIDYGNIVPYTPIVIRNTWFEAIATASTINRDGIDEVPRQLKLINTPQAFIEESYLTNVELINSNLIARKCRIDSISTNVFSINVDENSTLIAEDVYANGGIGGNVLVKSVASQSYPAGNQNLSLLGAVTVSSIKNISVYNGSVSVKETYTGTVGSTTWTLGGTTNVTAKCVDDGVHASMGCAEATFPAGNTNVTPAGNILQGKWYVWGVNAKLISGDCNIDFVSTVTLGKVYLKQGEWVGTFGIGKSNRSGNTRLNIVSKTETKIRFQNYFIVEFNSERDAVEFCNSRIAVV